MTLGSPVGILAAFPLVGKVNCVTGMAPGSPLSGDISPILHLYLSHGVVQNSSSLPSCIIQVCQGRQEYWVYLVIFSIIYDLDHPEKARGSAHVVRRLSVRSATRSPSTRPHVLAIMRECVKVSTRVHPGHPLTLSICPPRRDQQWDGWTDELTQSSMNFMTKVAFDSPLELWQKAGQVFENG